MLWKALPDRRPELALDRDICLGDEIDLALLVDLDALAKAGHLQLASTNDRVNGGLEETRVG